MNQLPASARLVGIGFYVAVCIVLGTLGGRELDKLLSTGKVLTLVGLAVGLTLAIWGGLAQLFEVMREISGQGTGRNGQG